MEGEQSNSGWKSGLNTEAPLEDSSRTALLRGSCSSHRPSGHQVQASLLNSHVLISLPCRKTSQFLTLGHLTHWLAVVITLLYSTT